MSEHLTAEQIERYHGRSLTPAELLTAHEHLAGCEECRERLSEVVHPLAALAGLRTELREEARAEPDHPAHEQLAQYVDEERALDDVDRELIASHLEICPRCSAETQDLLRFRELMTRFPTREYTPAPAPSLWEKLLDFWRPPARWMPLQLAATAAAAVLCVSLATRPLQSQVAELQGQLRQLQQANATVQQQVAHGAELRTQLAQLQRETERLQRAHSAATADVARLRTQLAQLQHAAPPAISGPGSSSPAMPGAPLTLALHDAGGQVGLDQAGHLRGLPPLPASLQQSLKVTLQQRKAPTPRVIAQLLGEHGTLLSGSAENGIPFELRTPIGTVVRGTRPVFQWRKLEGSARYSLVVTDENEVEAAQSPPLAEATWTPPKPLQRGQVYVWQVTAIKDGEEIVSRVPPAPPARFKILDAKTAAQLARAERQYAGSHLTLGVLYANAGLLDDAEREFRRLRDANPDSQVAQKLLQNLQALRRK